MMVLAMAQNKIDTGTINKTIETLNWTTIGGNISTSIQRVADGSPNEITKSVLNICNKAVDFFGYTIFEIAKLAMQVARDHPDIINYKVLFYLIVLSLLAPLIYPTFMITVSLILFIKEYLANRKEKKELLRIKNKGVQNGINP
jgi:hypothetical protein